MTWFRFLPLRRDGWSVEVCELFGFRILLHATLLLLLIIPIGLLFLCFLFPAILVHELAHAVVGKNVGYGTGRITIWVMGGLYQADDYEFELLQMTKAERWRFIAMVAAGPLANLALGGLFGGLYLLTQADWSFFLAWVNIFLGVGNLLPIPRFDGGQIVRALAIQSKYR